MAPTPFEVFEIREAYHSWLLRQRSPSYCWIWGCSVAFWPHAKSVKRSWTHTRVALKIILADSYLSYANALSVCNLDTLEDRRLVLCTNFAVKLYCSERRRQFFDQDHCDSRTRSQKRLVKENITRTKRSYLAPHNFLARLVNLNQKAIEKRS